jgi:hypothetical protein
MLIRCDCCSNEFDKKPVHIKENERLGYKHYCSKACAARGKLRGQWHICNQCGEHVYRTPNQVSKTKSGQVFCSRSCSAVHSNGFRVGPAHPNFKDGMSRYREKALKTYGAFCVICGYNTVAALQVHHIDSDRSNNSLSNLMVLCPTHHIEIELGIITYGVWSNGT